MNLFLHSWEVLLGKALASRTEITRLSHLQDRKTKISRSVVNRLLMICGEQPMCTPAANLLKHTFLIYVPPWTFVACNFKNTLTWYLLILHSLAYQGEPQQNTDIMLCHLGAVWGQRYHLLTSLRHKHETREGWGAERWEKGEVEREQEVSQGRRRKETRARKTSGAEEPRRDSETLDSPVARRWWRIPETCGIVLEKAEQQLS